MGRARIQLSGMLVSVCLGPHASLRFQMRGDNPEGGAIIGGEKHRVQGAGKTPFFGTLRADYEMRSVLKGEQRVHVQATHGIPLSPALQASARFETSML